MTWRDQADVIIAAIDETLPADASLKERRKALTAAKPYQFAVTSWGKKVWSKAARAYLEKHGLPPLKPAPDAPLLSPLERMYAKARAAQ